MPSSTKPQQLNNVIFGCNNCAVALSLWSFQKAMKSI